MKLLVTGAAGFIGSTYVRLVKDEHDVVVLDKLTYAGRRENLPEGVELVVGAIEDRELVLELAEGVDAIVNFAAESHVDRSIADQNAFARTHVIGTSVLLDAARERGVARYLQVSTDEVYGSIEEGSFTESSPLDPSSPYSATKAGGDLLVSAYAHTHGLEAVICRGSNNYGPRQYPEKLIPLCVLNALHGDKLPVYGDGRQVRNWLYVEDFCRGIHAVLEGGRPGEAYNVGGPDECENIEVVRRIVELTGGDESLIEYVKDRPGHDRRYSLASDKIRAELGWEAQVRFADGHRPNRRLVPRQRGLVGADPLGRVPRVLRAAVRAGPGRLASAQDERPGKAAEGRRRCQRPDDVPSDPRGHEVVAHSGQVLDAGGVTRLLQLLVEREVDCDGDHHHHRVEGEAGDDPALRSWPSRSDAPERGRPRRAPEHRGRSGRRPDSRSCRSSVASHRRACGRRPRSGPA